MHPEDPYRAAAAVIFLTTVSISGYHRRRAARLAPGMRRGSHGSGAANTALRVSGLLFFLPALAYLIHPPAMAWSQVALPGWIRWTGALIGAATIPFFYQVFRSLGTNVTPTVDTRERHTLVTRGPYRWVRHPLYSAGFVAWAGFALLTASAYFAALLPPLVWAIVRRTRSEEANLEERFGEEYREYARRAGRFLPRLGQPPAPPSGTPRPPRTP